MAYDNDYLMHHGIKGQKWGVRRFQNEDGTLTSEGQARYGTMKNRGDQGLIKKWTLGSEGGEYAFAKWRSRRHDKNLKKWQNRAAETEGQKQKKQRKIEKYESKKAAQGAANANLAAYREHSSTAKLMIQNVLGASVGGNVYRRARARGEGRISALVETATPIGPILSLLRNKKAYGKYIVWSEPNENDYNANAIEK